jgi:GNAT superfamily N-acetyltransferase
MPPIDPKMNLNIRKLSKEDDVRELTRLIRDSYSSLLEKGFRYWGTFQSVEDTAKRFSEGEGYLAIIDKKIVGTITLKHKHTGWEESPWYDRKDVCFFTQFAIDPQFQKSGLGSQMMNFVERRALQKGFREIALDTCEMATGLIDYYKKRGYRFIEHVQWDLNVVNYRSVVLSKAILKGSEKKREETPCAVCS